MPSLRSRKRPPAARLAPSVSELEAMVEARFGPGKPGTARIDQPIGGPAEVVYFDNKGKEVGRETYGRKADESIALPAVESEADVADEDKDDEDDSPALKAVHRDDDDIEDKAVTPRRGRPPAKK